ncbi:MAG: TIGR04255 family protein [Candidatus Helarchaeota archaeon]|nr:TIGR04255 family protein [Candidatus Helarchaeota archaeon]
MSAEKNYRYEKPPVIEILWEIRYQSIENWDWTIPGLLYSQLKDKYPKKQQVNLMEMEMQFPKGIHGPSHRTANKGIAKMIFLNQEETFLVQIAPNLIVCNQIKPYTHWNDFKKNSLFVFNKYLDVIKIKSIDRINLRYIDRIDIPETTFEFDDYFNYYIHYPEEMPNYETNQVLIRSTITFKDTKGHLNITLSSPPKRQKNVSSFIFDWEYFMDNFKGIGLEDIEKWGEEAHLYIRKAFESCLTDKTRKLFGEKTYVSS